MVSPRTGELHRSPNRAGRFPVAAHANAPLPSGRQAVKPGTRPDQVHRELDLEPCAGLELVCNLGRQIAGLETTGVGPGIGSDSATPRGPFRPGSLAAGG